MGPSRTPAALGAPAGAVADGLQRPLGPVTGDAATVPGGLRQRAGRAVQGISGHIPSRRGVDHRRQRLALGRWEHAVHAARRLVGASASASVTGPYHPQTLGKDERFHRTLKAELLGGPPFGDLGRNTASGPSAAGASSTTGSGPTRPSTWTMHDPPGSDPARVPSPRPCRPESSSAASKTKAASAQRRSSNCPRRSPDTRSDWCQPTRNSTCEMAQSKLLPMSPNTAAGEGTMPHDTPS